MSTKAKAKAAKAAAVKSQSVGRQLTMAAVNKGLSTGDVAKSIGISGGYCAHIMADHIAIKPDLAKRFEKALGVKFSKETLEKHNAIAKEYWTQYRLNLKLKKDKEAKSTKQQQLPGFAEQLPGGSTVQEMVAEMIGQALLQVFNNGKRKTGKVG